MRDILLTPAQALTIETTAVSSRTRHESGPGGVGRFAVFADRGQLRARGRDGDDPDAPGGGAEGFEAGGRVYAGGWSNWRFDCAARTGDRLDFASLAEDGAEGLATPEN